MHESEHLGNETNPEWETAGLYLDELCENDHDKPFRISLFDWDEGGDHKPMGFFETTVTEVLQASKVNDLRDEEGGDSLSFKLEQDGKQFGEIVVVSAELPLEEEYSGSQRSGSLYSQRSGSQYSQRSGSGGS